MKKPLIVLIVMLVIGIFGVAAQSQSMAIDPSTVNVSPGETVTFSVVISGLTNGLERINVDLEIGSDCAADLTGVTEGNLSGFTYLTTTDDISSDGKSVTLSAFTMSEYTGTGGTVYTLEVTGKTSGNTSCPINIVKNSINDKDGNDITGAVSVISGSLNIGGTTTPDTSITDGPSGTINSRDVSFSWTGSDDNTSTSDLVYSYILEGKDSSWSSWTSSTSKSYSGLSNGSYTFKVKAKDQTGNIDDSPASRSFTVDISDGEVDEGFESGDFSQYSWQTGGDGNWSVVSSTSSSGSYSAEAPTGIGNNDSSYLKVTLVVASGGGEVSFHRKVSSEGGYDFLRFYIDGSKQGEWSGSKSWSQKTYSVSGGTHTFKWVYNKDYSVSNNQDTAWIDDIKFPPVSAPPGSFRMEIGQVSLNHNWTTVNLNDSYNNPVVVAGPPTFNGSDPAVIRIKDVTHDSFKIRLQEWDHEDGTHTTETVNYMVMKRGYWSVNGQEVEAGTVDTDNTGAGNFLPVSFSQSFPAVPVVTTSIMTFNGSQAATVRMHNVTKDNYKATMQEQEANGPSHANETISYIAWEEGTGTVDGRDYEIGKTGNQCTDSWNGINLSFGSSVEVKVEEETSKDSEIGHTTENVGYMAFSGSTLLVADMQTADGNDTSSLRYEESTQTQLTMESGQVSLDHTWTTVNLNNSYSEPVVIAKPSSFNGSQPATVRIKDVSSTSFQVRMQEWDYLDGNHATETVSYLVAESGHHTLDSGLEIEAGKVNTSATGSFTNIGFSSSFPSDPVVFSTVTTFNGGDTVATRNKSVSTSGFEVGMQKQEAKTQYHTTETINYVAIEKGSGTMNGKSFEVGTTGNNMTESWQQLSFGFGSSTTVQVDEETSGDDEIGHTTENVGYLALDTSPLNFLADMQTCDGGNTANLRYGGSAQPEVTAESGEVNLDHTWTTVDLNNSYTDPVVVAKPFSYNGHDPGSIRVRNLTSNSFEIRIQEWLYKDGSHTSESVGYIVMESGHHTLSDGAEVEAGNINTDNTGTSSFKLVNFSSSFPSTPVVVSAVTTFNGGDTVATRNQNVSSSGFEVTMQEEEAKAPSHTTETIGYIAWEKGSGTVGGKDYQVGTTGNSVTDSFSSISLSGFSSAPVFVADMQTTDGSDTAGLRYKSETASSVEIQVDEETSNDDETHHTTENVGFIAIASGATATSTGKETEASSNLRLNGTGVYPNPLKTGNTLSFQANGSGIEEVKVKVASTNGSPVYSSGFVEGTTVSWTPEEQLSNGIYLYRITAKGATQVKSGKWRKLLVLR